MLKITNKLIDDVSKEAKASKRKRCNYNFHTRYNDPIQRFLNAVEPDTYLRPHKHENQDKTEIFLILKGRVLILEFDDNGKIMDHIILDAEGENKGVEIPFNTWHSFISLQESSVLYEIKEGPFIQEKGKIFANWSPEEGTKEAHGFNKKILQELRIPPENLQ
jgi:cupin fold WbuC family metalloprotein